MLSGMNMDIFSQDNLFLLLAVLWTLPWKGVALWRAARLRDKWWFIALLVLNTLAVLEILYIYWISKRKGLGEKSDTASIPVGVEDKPQTIEFGKKSSGEIIKKKRKS